MYPAGGKMARGFSTYLDLLRLLAAFVVFLGHWAGAEFTGVDPRLRAYGHSAVVVFFVLSGYVITFVALEREYRLPVFVASRAARIYSVALPALALTAGIDLILVAHGYAAEIPTYQLAAPWRYLPLFLGFGTDFWFLREDAFSDVPYWSLCYEVWYYTLFAAWHYGRGGARLGMIGALLLLIGPRLWLLLPVWTLGSLLYRAHRRVVLRPRVARLLFVVSLLALLAEKAIGIEEALNGYTSEMLGPAATEALRYSRFFLGDYVFAGLIAANLFSARDCGWSFGAMGPLITYGASFTFSLYLMHYPLLQFFARLFEPPPTVLAVAVLMSAWALGLVTERQKRWLRTVILWGINRRSSSTPTTSTG
jgi:peptidoglycan/LPS O-acetylase OafA/YrhL